MKDVFKTVGAVLLLLLFLFIVVVARTAPYGWDMRCLVAECRIQK